MPNTLTNDQIISATYVALFQRAPDKAGLMFWEDAAPTYGADGSVELAIAMANQFAQHPAFTTIYGGLGNAAFINAIYQNIGGKPADAAGRDFWLGKLTDAVNPISRGDLVGEFIYTVLSITPAELAAQQANGDITMAELTDALARQDRLTNKAAVGLEFTNALADGSSLNPATDANSLASLQMDPAYLASKAIIAGVTEVDATMTAPNAYLAGAPTLAGIIAGFGDVVPPVEGGPIRLTTGVDILPGTGADDTFTSNVVQNNSGAQVNTLGSGDELNGLGGIDTLNAKITAGAFAGGSGLLPGGTFAMPIQPETMSVEVINLQAVNAGILNVGGGQLNELVSTNVYVNAKDMVGVTDIGSVYSDANLVIQNMTTRGLEQLSDMTIHMEYTGSRDTNWTESDLNVYFDQDYLTPEATRTKPSVDFLAMNEDAYDQLGVGNALNGVFFRELQFRLNGETFDLTEYLNEDPLGTGGEIKSYADFLAAVQAALVELKADNADNAALQTVTADYGQTFKTDVNPNTLVQREGVGIRLSVDGLTAGTANTLNVQSTDLEVARAASATVNNNNRYEIASDTPALGGEKLGINVALEKVGLAGDGGDLVIGSMNKQPGNTYDAVNTTVDGTTSGIEEFYVTVYGNKSKSSSLAGLHSTNNNLKLVTVESEMLLGGNSYANLTIGNSNTQGSGTDVAFSGRSYEVDTPDAANQNALKDVQTFDASGFKGDLTLFAALTREVTEKYLDIIDIGDDAAGDNDNFAYTSGSGNDYINLFLNPSNLAQRGTATREDLTLTVDTGAGNDEVLVRIGDNDSNWYANQSINADLKMAGGLATGQLQINTGTGNDIVRTLESGDYAINLGDGNDTAYVDNTGNRSNWTINAVNNNISNLLSEPAVAPATKIANLFLNVSFKGFDAKVNVGGSAGSLTGVSITDLTINQAIKNAINNDPVLSKLLIAEDGPGRTLVIKSLIDGVQSGDDDIDDVVISLSTTPLSPGQLLNASALSGAQATALGFDAATLVAINGGRFDANDTGNGTNSGATSDNLIVGGLGDDVLVLGTGADSNDTVGYAGFGNGRDSIVNFTTGEFGDVLATTEEVQVAFAGVEVGGNTTVTFNGVTVTLAAGDATAIATQFAADYTAAAPVGTWTVVDNGDGTVTVTAPASGAIANITAADFVVVDTPVPADSTPVTVAISANVDGTALTAETFKATFAGTEVGANTTVVFDGVTVTLAANVGGAAIAGDYVAQYNLAGGSFTAAAAGAVVTFTKNVNGDLPNKVAADFVITDVVGDSPAVTVSAITVVEGAPAGLGQTATNADALDFSAYNAQGVYVDGVLVAGNATTALGQTYITMVESATNDGSYTMTQYLDAGVVGLAGDTVVGIIGVADFGAQLNFLAESFVI